MSTCSQRKLTVTMISLDIISSVLSLILMLYGEDVSNLFPLIITFIVPTLELPGRVLTSHRRKFMVATMLVRAGLVLYNSTQMYLIFSCTTCPTDITAILVLSYFGASQIISLSFKIFIECITCRSFEITNDVTP